MLFNFELERVEDIEPWGKGDDLSLTWFGLTDGWYWIRAGEEELFRAKDSYLATFQRTQRLPYVNYQVVRLWEDLQDNLPGILEPVPAVLLRQIEPGKRADNWSGKILDHFFPDDVEFEGEVWENFCRATDWLHGRILSTGHLRNAPAIWLWNDGVILFLRWDSRQGDDDQERVWASEKGELQLPMATFVEELRDFDRRLIAAMEQRVLTLEQGKSRAPCAIDLKRLREEQIERAESMDNAFRRAQAKTTSWDEVIAAIEFFRARGFDPAMEPM